MRRAALFVAGAVSLLACTTASAEPTITIYTDAETYRLGDTIKLSLSGRNRGDGMSLAVYLGLLTPDGGIYTTQFDGWSEGLEPWIPEIYVPSGFTVYRSPFWLFGVPCPMPPIQEPGNYSFAAVLTYPGTFDWVSPASFAPFSVVSQSDFHGGELTEDMTLSGDIMLTRDVVIREGVVLTISSGSGVRLGKGVGIYVYGGLIAEGDAPDSIVFERLYPNGAWENISFWDSADDDQCRLVCCSISGGRGTYDYAGLQGGGISCYESSPTIANNTISGNTATHGYGGGIYCWRSSPTISNNTITGNTASFGGGIYCYGSSPTISNNTITGNTAPFGGGIYCYFGSPTMSNNRISDNTAKGDWGGGGGIYCCGSSSPTIRNDTISDNSAYYGGGIYCMDYSCPTIENNTISDNLATYYGGGIFRWGYSSPTISDCIIWANGMDDLGYCSATYCCIQENNEGEGNIHDDPMFVSGPFGEYYLHPDSPCIDAGSQSAVGSGLSDRTTRADGTPDTGTVDMGYHYPIP